MTTPYPTSDDTPSADETTSEQPTAPEPEPDEPATAPDPTTAPLQPTVPDEPRSGEDPGGVQAEPASPGETTEGEQPSLPLDEPAAEEAPAEETPAREAPAPEFPAEEAPARETPAQGALAEVAPAGESPDAAEPVDEDNEDTEDDASDGADEVAPGGHEPNPEAVADAPPKARAEKRPKQKPAKPAGPTPQDIVRRIGDTNARALAYVLDPDPQLTRLSRKAREAVLADLPPVTAGALLGPAALARHFVASAASGRYRDLFTLWDLFRQRTDEVKPVLAERQRALEKAREVLVTAARLGLRGRADRVAEDVTAAQGLIWQWLRAALMAELAAVAARPAVAAALLAREPDLELALPAQPSDRWITEAAALQERGPLPPALDALLAANAHRLPATVATLTMAHEQYPDRIPALLERVDLDAPEVGSALAWARDHGFADQLHGRIGATVDQAAAGDRAGGLALWQQWQDRGIDLPLPAPLRVHSLEGLDLSRPETATLIARLVAEGADIRPQETLDSLAQQNRQSAEKAYEAFVCARLDVHLPLALEGNPIVRDGTRCPHCQAWTWVRPGHERRCPHRPAVVAGAGAARAGA